MNNDRYQNVNISGVRSALNTLKSLLRTSKPSQNSGAFSVNAWNTSAAKNFQNAIIQINNSYQTIISKITNYLMAVDKMQQVKELDAEEKATVSAMNDRINEFKKKYEDIITSGKYIDAELGEVTLNEEEIIAIQKELAEIIASLENDINQTVADYDERINKLKREIQSLIQE